MNKVSRILLVVAAASAVAMGSGCYSNWPPIDTPNETREMNNPPNVSAMTTALRGALARYNQGGGPVVVNFPPLLRRGTRLTIAKNAGVSALTKENETSGTLYHVARCEIRPSSADVEIIVPATARGSGREQLVTFRLWGGPVAWEVASVREWETLTRPVPELSYLPENDDPIPLPKVEPWRRDDVGSTAPAEPADAGEM